MLIAISNFAQYKEINKLARSKGKSLVNNNFMLPNQVKELIAEGRLFYATDEKTTLFYVERDSYFELLITGIESEVLPLVDTGKPTKFEYTGRGSEQDLEEIRRLMTNNGFELLAENFEMSRRNNQPYEQVVVDPLLDIRILQADEIPQVISIWNASLDARINPLPDQDAISSHPDSYFTIHYADKIVGAWASKEQGKRVTIEHIAVTPSMRGRGIGTQAIGLWVEKNGSKDLYLWVESNNQAAIHIYNKFGFEPTGKKAIQFIKESGL